MTIKVSGVEAITKKLNTLKNAHEDQTLISKVGFMAIDLIEARTAAGKDVNGKAFKPYSKGYVDRISGKVKAKGVTKKQSSIVTLEAKGHMLRNMTNRVEGSKAVVLFPDSLQNTKAFVHHTGDGKMPKRAFFSLSKFNMTAINNYIKSYYAKKING